MQQSEIDKFYSLLLFSELVLSGHSSESHRVYEYVRDTFNLAIEIVEYAIQNKKYGLYHKIITACQDLDLSHKQTVLKPNQKQVMHNLYMRFMVQTGNLLEENPAFAYTYNEFVVELAQELKTKKRAR